MSLADSLDASRLEGYENVLTQLDQDQSTINQSRLEDETDNSLDVSQLEARPRRKKARTSVAGESGRLGARVDATPRLSSSVLIRISASL